MYKKISPCMFCTRVENPLDCDNKQCRLWQSWFLERWEQLRQQVRQAMDGPVEPVGVVVGGRHYAAPHQVADYLATDPCRECACPKGLCQSPCRLKRGWQAARELGR